MNAFSTPLVDCFRQGEAPRDVRLLAARGDLALRAEVQLSLLMLLVSDADPEVRAAAETTIARLPRAQLAALAAVPDLPDDLREFFGAKARDGAAAQPSDEAGPHADADVLSEPAAPVESVPGAETGAGDAPAPDDEGPERVGAAQRLALLPVSERVKVATQGSREERQILVRDPNRLVSLAVLSSPKLTESEVEAISRMTNVSAEVLRAVGTSRAWLKNYAVVSALTRNAKTPIAIALTLINRLAERDIKFLSTDRNIPEPVRLAARKMYVHSVSRRK